MLTQCTQCREARATGVQRAHIYLLLVAGARKVLIKACERAVGAVAQVALERATVPGRRRSVVGDLLRGVTAGEEAGGIGDYVARVVLLDQLVDGIAVNA